MSAIVKSLRNAGSPVASRAARRSSIVPPKNNRSVNTDSAAAPPDSYALAVIAGSRSGARSPFDGDRRFSAANTRCKEPSGDACDHFWRYPADIALLAELGFGAYRFSIEWSRIEPEDGEFSRAALDHYRRMIATCRDHDLVPIVTFHHFTTP